MSEYIIQGDTLTAIGNAVRGKTGGSSLLTPLQMPAAIAGIPNRISYTNPQLDGTVSKGTGSETKTFNIEITGTAGKNHRLYAARAITSSTSSSVHTPIIKEALTDVTDSVTETEEGDTVTYTWEWESEITRSSSSTKYYKTTSLLLLLEE